MRAPLPRQRLKRRIERGGNPRVFAGLDEPQQRREPGRSLRRDDAHLGQEPAQAIAELGALANQKIARPMQSPRALLLDALNRHEAHVRPQRRFADCLGVACVGLVALHERLHIGGGHETRLVPERADDARPMMRRAAGLHDDQAARQRGEVFFHPLAPQPRRDHLLSRGVDPVNLEDVLRDIQSDRDKLHDGRPPCLVRLIPPASVAR